jgi:hypothetical protein
MSLTRDPWKTTRLIGRACKRRNAFSEAVLTVNDLILPTGFRHPTMLQLPVLGSLRFHVSRPIDDQLIHDNTPPRVKALGGTCR